MSEPGPSGQSLPASHGGAAAAGQPYFPAAEWERLQQNDRMAGAIIVCLMGGIFTIGLILYVGVCLSIHWGW
jgi:hypothetical protein